MSVSFLTKRHIVCTTRLAPLAFIARQKTQIYCQRSFATKKEETGFGRIRFLFKEHGLSFALVYSGAYLSTCIPIYAGLELSGVDGIALCGQAIDYLGFHTDLSWLENNPYLNRHVVNALIAMELNGMIEFARLPIVMYATPSATKWINAKRGKIVTTAIKEEKEEEEQQLVQSNTTPYSKKKQKKQMKAKLRSSGRRR